MIGRDGQPSEKNAQPKKSAQQIAYERIAPMVARECSNNLIRKELRACGYGDEMVRDVMDFVRHVKRRAQENIAKATTGGLDLEKMSRDVKSPPRPATKLQLSVTFQR